MISLFFKNQETGKQRDRQKDDQSVQHWRIHTGRQLANLGVHRVLSQLNENSMYVVSCLWSVVSCPISDLVDQHKDHIRFLPYLFETLGRRSLTLSILQADEVVSHAEKALRFRQHVRALWHLDGKLRVMLQYENLFHFLKSIDSSSTN